MKVPSYEERLQWFHQARFGMFIHYGLYSMLERGEWVMYNERIPADDYAPLAARFNPARLDPASWVALASDAGMKYMVLTTRHHEGFCLFDSAVSEFKSTNSPLGRDIVAEYVKAARKAGMKVGFYYSLLDWRFPGYFEPDRHPESARALVEQAHAQVRELLTGYGKIDVLWYDGHWPSPGKKGFGSKSIPDFWRATELNAMARGLQPHIIINNRSGLDEDLDTPEQHVTASRAGRGWESCMTMGDSCGWGYIRNNPNMKSVPQLLQNLVRAAAGEGNYLLNIGPKGDGSVRKEEVERLGAIGRWMRVNGKAIYGSMRAALPGGMIGEWTRNGKVAYLHVMRWPGEEAVVPLVKGRALSAKLLATGERVKVRQEHNGRLVILNLPKKPPHPALNVIEVRFAEVPKPLVEKDESSWLDGSAR